MLTIVKGAVLNARVMLSFQPGIEHGLLKLVRAIILCSLLLAPTLASFGQAQVSKNDVAAEAQHAFDVVSIRPSAKEAYSHWRTGTEGYSATNVTAQQLLFYAYTQTDEPDGFNNIISLDQITALPKWAVSEQFDVTAKVDQETMSRLSPLSERDRRKIYQKMLQSVLVERFQLQIQHEKREQSVYLLVPSREGSKLVQSNLPFGKSSLSVGRGQISAKGYKVGELIANLAQATGRIVVDQTHLTGVYDFELKWRPDDQPESANTNPSIFTAVREQLGLALVPSKGPVDSIVITHLERPTSN